MVRLGGGKPKNIHITNRAFPLTNVSPGCAESTTTSVDTSISIQAPAELAPANVVSYDSAFSIQFCAESVSVVESGYDIVSNISIYNGLASGVGAANAPNFTVAGDSIETLIIEITSWLVTNSVKQVIGA